jgi:hypothetical protein
MKKLLIAAVLVGAASVLAYLHGNAQTYHPVVKIAAPDGVVYTAVLDATHDRPACGERSKRFLEPMRERCPACEVMLARCERELEGMELAMELDLPIPLYVVTMAGARIAIAAEESIARLTCDYIAKLGGQSAACIVPKTKSLPRSGA